MGRMGWARVCVHPTASQKQQLEAAVGPGAELGSWRLSQDGQSRVLPPDSSPCCVPFSLPPPKKPCPYKPLQIPPSSMSTSSATSSTSIQLQHGLGLPLAPLTPRDPTGEVAAPPLELPGFFPPVKQPEFSPKILPAQPGP